jgi:4-hydroxythreonine-4-phosphate dehydrogenase
MSRPLVVTVGDPGGIGPEVAVSALARLLSAKERSVQLIMTRPLLDRTLDLLKKRVANGPDMARQIESSLGDSLALVEPTASPAEAEGRWSEAQIPFIRESLERGLAAANSGATLVTGPTDKRFFLAEGMSFAGHTEYLAGHYPGHEPLMLFEAGSFRIAVLTRHIPLAHVTAAVTKERLTAAVKVASAYVKVQNSQSATIAVAGLDPHCGEWGAFSGVDLKVRGWIEELLSRGFSVEGPLAADTLFVPHRLAQYGAILCWYHDQGMIPIKLLRFDSAVNVTLGLPILRVSPAHGVAYDIAWKGVADAGSFYAALCVGAREPAG